MPGLHYDEAKEAGVNAMQMLRRQPVTAFRDAAVQLGPLTVPLMVQDYIGSLNVLLAVPFLAAGGVRPESLRLLPLLIGALTLIPTWFLGQRLGGRLAAILAVFMLAVNPTFVFWSRQGIFVTNIVALIFMSSLLTAIRWWDERRPLDLWSTAFLWGLGIYAKLLFVWAIVAMVVVGLMASIYHRTGRGATTSPRQTHPVRDWMVAAVALVLPLTPLLLFNLQTGGTLASVFGNLDRSYYGISNAAYGVNLVERLDQIGKLVAGDHLWYLGGGYGNPLAAWIAAALLALAASAWWTGRRDGSVTARWWLPPLLASLIVAQSAFTVSGLFITHFMLLLPLAPLGAGLAVQAVHQRETVAPRWRTASILALLLVVLWGATDLWLTARYHQSLRETGGRGAHSEATNRMANYLNSFDHLAPAALDWGIDAPVRFLTGGRVAPVEVFGYDRLEAPDDGFDARMEPFLRAPGAIFVAHVPEQRVFLGRMERLEQLAAGRGLRLEELSRFDERSGGKLFVIYRATLP
jgi:hypothetical protein